MHPCLLTKMHCVESIDGQVKDDINSMCIWSSPFLFTSFIKSNNVVIASVLASFWLFQSYLKRTTRISVEGIWNTKSAMLSSQTPDEFTGRQREMLQNIKNYRPTPTPSLSLKNKLSELVANSTLPLFFWGGVWNYKKRQRKKCKKVAPGYNRQEGKEWIEDLRGGKTGLTGVFVGGLAGRTGGRVKIVTQNKQFHQFGKSMAQRLRTWALESGCLGPWALFCPLPIM